MIIALASPRVAPIRFSCYPSRTEETRSRSLKLLPPAEEDGHVVAHQKTHQREEADR